MKCAALSLALGLATVGYCDAAETSRGETRTARPEPAARVYASPAEVLAAEQLAFDTWDWNTWGNCFSSESQNKQVEFFLSLFARSRGPNADPSASGVARTGGSKEETHATGATDRMDKFKAICAEYGLTDFKRGPRQTEQQYVSKPQRCINVG